MLLQRWDPFREMMTLREAMDRLIGDSFVRSGNWQPANESQPIAFEVHESESGYALKAELPGIKPEDVEILAQGDSLTIRGTRKADEERREEGYLLREHRYGSFSRTVTLPAAFDADRAEAHFEDGVLTLTLPKSESAKPKQIKVGTQLQLGSGVPKASGTDQTKPAGAQAMHTDSAVG